MRSPRQITVSKQTRDEILRTKRLIGVDYDTLLSASVKIVSHHIGIRKGTKIAYAHGHHTLAFKKRFMELMEGLQEMG